MLRTDLPDHRRSSESDLVQALRARDSLALAEAYHRTIAAAHACARRLLASSSYVEALLRAAYAELWAQPPQDAPLEGWIRARCFELGTQHLRERGAAPASPSLAGLVDDLPAPQVRYLDVAERALADLDPAQRRALLLAHDCGVSTAEQEDDGAPEALRRGLLSLAAAAPSSIEVLESPGGADVDADCSDLAELGDWVLGLVPPQRAGEIDDAVAARPECAELSRTLRRGRRRLEGLPPTPDMGQRVLAVVLADAPAAAPQAAAPGEAAAAAEALRPSADDEAELPPWALPPQGVEDTTVVPASRAGTAVAPADTDDPTEDLTAVTAAMQVQEVPEAAGDGAPADEIPEAQPDAPSGARASDGAAGLSPAQRALRWLGALLLLLAGTALGLYLGFLIVQAL